MKRTDRTTVLRNHRLAGCLLASGLALASSAACAAIDLGDVGTGDGEFVLVVFDPVAKASYTLDLGYKMESLLVDGQADAGFQKFWTLDTATDPRFKKLRDLGTASSSLQWGVIAVDIINSAGITGIAFDAADLRIFTTLQHTVDTGTTNPYYTQLLGLTNNDVTSASASFSGSLFASLNNEAGNADNTHSADGPAAYESNGSALHLEGQAAYFGGNSFPELALPGGPSILNAVGSSSWAYQVLNSSTDTAETALVDEFDNLTHDGFWGLAVDTDGTFALSFTIEGSDLTLAQRSFIQAIGRTELNSGFLINKLGEATSIAQAASGGLSSGLTSGITGGSVSAVPEPGTWGLMALGLLGVAAAARRRRA